MNPRMFLLLLLFSAGLDTTDAVYKTYLTYRSDLADVDGSGAEGEVTIFVAPLGLKGGGIITIPGQKSLMACPFGCGVAVYNGTGCDPALRGDINYDVKAKAVNPWLSPTPAKYDTTDPNGTTTFQFMVPTVLTDIANKPFIVQDKDRKPVACGLLQQVLGTDSVNLMPVSGGTANGVARMYSTNKTVVVTGRMKGMEPSLNPAIGSCTAQNACTARLHVGNNCSASGQGTDSAVFEPTKYGANAKYSSTDNKGNADFVFVIPVENKPNLTGKVAAVNNNAGAPAACGVVKTANAGSHMGGKSNFSLMHPPPPDGKKTGFDVAYMLWMFLLTVFWGIFSCTQIPKGASRGPAFCLLFFFLMSACALGFNLLYETTQTGFWRYPVGVIFDLLSAVGIWMLIYYVGYVGWKRKDDMRCGGTYCHVIVYVAVAIVLSVLAIVISATQAFTWLKPIVLGWLELPQLVLLSVLMAVSSDIHPDICGEDTAMHCCNSGLITTIGWLFAFLPRLLMLVLAAKPEKLQNAYPILVPLIMFGTGLFSYGMSVMLKNKIFDKHDRNHVLSDVNIDAKKLCKDRQEREKQIEDGTRPETWTFSPEMLYTYGVPFVLLGYFISGTSFFNITKPNMSEDPVFKLYGTFHPCILLDYLPGTLAAQPCFGLGILLSQQSMLCAVFRAAAYGDATCMALTAFLFGWYWLLSCFFVLVFTLNPSATTVLLHSFPYMVMNVANAFFVFTTLVILCKWKGLKGYWVSVLGGVFYMVAILYGTIFMSKKLMSFEGLLVASQSAASPEALEATKNLKPDFDPFPMFVTLIAQGVILSWGLTSPLRYRPLATEVTSRERNVPGCMLPPAQDEYRDIDKHKNVHPSFSAVPTPILIRFCQRARTPLLIASILTPIIMLTAVIFDKRIHADVPADDFREMFRREPGAAIVAAGWMVIGNFYVWHVALVWLHEYRTNPSTCMRYWVIVAGLVFLIGALFAIAGTIPHANKYKYIPPEYYNWFKGLEFYCIAIAIWVMTQVALTCQRFASVMSTDPDDSDEEECAYNRWQKCFKCTAVLEITFGTLFSIMVIVAGFTKDISGQKLDAAHMLLFILFNICDARGIEVTFHNMRVAQPIDMMVQHVDSDDEDLEDDEDGLEWILPPPVINSIDPGTDLDGKSQGYTGMQLGKSGEDYE